MTCQGSVTFGCDCLIVKKEKEKKIENKKRNHHNCKVKQPGVPLCQSCFRFFQKQKEKQTNKKNFCTEDTRYKDVSPPVYTIILIEKKTNRILHMPICNVRVREDGPGNQAWIPACRLDCAMLNRYCSRCDCILIGTVSGWSR